MRLTPGTRLGPYEIVDALGAGGMGEVYRARDSRLRRDVAIKVVQRAEADRAGWERFEREARAASALSHPNICTVFDTGEADGQPYLVMELLDGQTLKERIGTKAMDPSAAVAIAVQIADALEAAHGKGILHRDIKPGNVMLVGRGHVKVLDFGLAKQVSTGESDETLTLRTETQAGTLMGTPAYLSPEVLGGAKADARSDLWALGVVLYQMLSGQLPFRGSTTLEISSGILKEVPPPLAATVPRGLRVLVERALQKKPDQRFQSAKEIRVALEALRGNAAPVTTGTKAVYWAVGAAALLVGGLLLWQLNRPELGPTGGPLSVNPQANVLFEQGIAAQRVQNDIPRAQELLARALALDPRFVEARRFHGLNYIILYLNGYTNDASSFDRAEEELRRVEQEAPDLPSLVSALTALYFVKGRQDLIPNEALDRVLEETQLPDPIIWRVVQYMYRGQNAAAKQLAEISLQKNGLVGAIRQLYGEILRSEGDVAGAIRELETVMDQAPGNMTATALLSLAYLDHGENAKSRQLLERQRAQYAANYLWRHASAILLATEGKRAEAEQMMDIETLKWADHAYLFTGFTADYYALLGDKRQALEWLQKAERNGDERSEWFRRDPRLANIQKDPDFLRFVEGIEARVAKR